MLTRQRGCMRSKVWEEEREGGGRCADVGLGSISEFRILLGALTGTKMKKWRNAKLQHTISTLYAITVDACAVVKDGAQRRYNVVRSGVKSCDGQLGGSVDGHIKVLSIASTFECSLLERLAL